MQTRPQEPEQRQSMHQNVADSVIDDLDHNEQVEASSFLVLNENRFVVPAVAAAVGIVILGFAAQIVITAIAVFALLPLAAFAAHRFYSVTKRTELETILAEAKGNIIAVRTSERLLLFAAESLVAGDLLVAYGLDDVNVSISGKVVTIVADGETTHVRAMSSGEQPETIATSAHV